MALTEPTTHYMFGMVFSNYQIMVPFTYGYGVYNVAEKKFYDLPEIKDESKFPDMREVLKSFEVGRALDEQVSGSTEVFLKYPKDKLNSRFPLVQKTKTGKYRLYAYCLPLYGNSKQFVTWAELNQALTDFMTGLITALTTTPIAGNGAPQPTWTDLPTQIDISGAKTTSVVTGG